MKRKEDWSIAVKDAVQFGVYKETLMALGYHLSSIHGEQDYRRGTKTLRHGSFGAQGYVWASALEAPHGGYAHFENIEDFLMFHFEYDKKRETLDKIKALEEVIAAKEAELEALKEML